MRLGRESCRRKTTARIARREEASPTAARGVGRDLERPAVVARPYRLHVPGRRRSSRRVVRTGYSWGNSYGSVATSHVFLAAELGRRLAAPKKDGRMRATNVVRNLEKEIPCF